MSITSLIFSLEGDLLFSGSMDTTIKVWQMNDFKVKITL